MPVWQQLFDSLKAAEFMIVAVAEESRGAEHARQWIEQANAAYWCLIDTEHRVADLYGMVNVPQAVWIDEAGRIVRPPENAGSTDHFRLMDRTTRTLAPEHQAARLQARTAISGCGARLGADRAPCAASRCGGATNCRASRRRLRWRRRISAWACGCDGTATRPKAMRTWRRRAGCIRIRGTSWRQAADLDEVGKASGEAFWQRVQALGDRPYYPPPDLA